MSTVTSNGIELLRTVSTATLCTQLFKRGFRNVFIQGCSRLTKASGNLVGPAFTVRNIPAREDLEQLSSLIERVEGAAAGTRREAVQRLLEDGLMLVLPAQNSLTLPNCTLIPAWATSTVTFLASSNRPVDDTYCRNPELRSAAISLSASLSETEASIIPTRR